MTEPNDVGRRVQLLNLELSQLPGVSMRAQSTVASAEGIRLDAVVRDAELYRLVVRLFNDGHHARAVEEAFKYLNNLVKRRSAIEGQDGSGLMKRAFSRQDPVLKLNAGSSSSELDEQLGYMEILSGCMIGIRNPRAHEHDWEDSEERALELLTLANHLVERVKHATNTKRG